MIWSIIPEDLIFAALPEEKKEKERKMISYLGRQVMVESHQKGARIIGLVSSNPMDFTDARFSPGTIIEKTSL